MGSLRRHHNTEPGLLGVTGAGDVKRIAKNPPTACKRAGSVIVILAAPSNLTVLARRLTFAEENHGKLKFT